ncbi:restriction endonuclease subunit S [Levilactobacillus tujiorum]|uniref:Type I restriction modification DNA specificity domain-containing protein n=1 Tax=Levilactobacillus tujiorum TaxID=2912243 RepID=A0ABX1L123_9LACO|nr:restriction endonuclease subunit S [Levilactobacillus tujiorum]MCH5463735.1 restriction endonuclease subunit S [Levilactobacillus tujiorum]NLR10942.1 hypothetical protein [Lactobacillus sp. HBUAS51387]NLR28722.1 hypothetical protein [Levilactobacillus tujiorum]
MMDNDKKMVPRIRFRGFEGDWEQRKAKNIFTAISKKGNPELPVLSVTQDEGVVPRNQLEKNINQKQSALSSYKVVTPGDFIISLRSFQGGFEETYLTGIVSPAYTVFSVLDKSNQYGEYWKSVFKRGFFIESLKKVTFGIRDGKAISFKAFSSLPLQYPSDVEEQKKIGGIFKNLDALIAVSEKKDQQLDCLKRLFMKNIFSQEWRFEGFTDPWEQRKLGEYYYFKNGINKGKKYFGKGIPIINYTDVFHNRSLCSKDIFGKVQVTESEQQRFSIEVGDVLFTRTSETITEIGYSSVVLDCSNDTIFSGFLIRGRALTQDPLDNLFKKYVFFSSNFRKEMKRKSSMTTRALTSGAALSEMYISFPKGLSEQRQIGLIVTRLDNLIVANEKKLDQLKQLKKYLMQNMFV